MDAHGFQHETKDIFIRSVSSCQVKEALLALGKRLGHRLTACLEKRSKIK